MAKDFAKSFYRSKDWEQCRRSYIDARIMTDGGLCEECKQALGYIVHHVVTLDSNNINDSKISLNHKKLKYVCKSCHDKIHYNDIFKIDKEKENYKFDKFGNYEIIVNSPHS